ncbi:oxygen-dependent coproporphyrinogen oxidase [Balneola vulgaris]|uniref:oxygen-dependent coproporphyrinogen oxidase n=1 Tax=Balneola vulgaris TaxID=287535 RepID=UPI00037922A9|nr:oxygen-dependent coproporphyrinogen oxidase [Balneola vulgaris]
MFDSKKEAFKELVAGLQTHICTAIEEIDGKATFKIEDWTREGFGYGSTRVISEGNIFEKGGVNISAVEGALPKSLQEKLETEESDFFATGISLVLHPQNPFIPTVHANYRYFELYDKETGAIKDQWFGGGADLTPYYLFEEDAKHFHRVHKTVCDATHPEFYPRFKEACDNYFFNHHRDETRGVGGLFYDHLRANNELSANDLFDFAKAAGQAFTEAYLPIVERRKELSWTEEQRYWQEIRRGRYVEFNLIHDRGTLFGLKTKGRIESILMSLPPRVRWDYNFQPEPNSAEAKLLEHLKPIDWLNLNS